ncbi:hypothetical protein MIFL109517_10270 [Micrococcus flavus]
MPVEEASGPRRIGNEEDPVPVAGGDRRADRGDHPVHRRRGHQSALHERTVEAHHVPGGGDHGGRSREHGLVQGGEAGGLPRPDRGVLHLRAAHQRPLLEAGPVHAGRPEDALADEPRQRSAGDGLHHQLGHHVARVGVAPRRARLEPPRVLPGDLHELAQPVVPGHHLLDVLEGQVPQGPMPQQHPDRVRHAGGVVQQLAQGHVLASRPQAGQDLADGRVEPQGPPLDLLEGDGGGHRLGHAGHPGHGRGAGRGGEGGRAPAGGQLHHPPVRDERPDRPDDGPRHQGVEGGLHPGGAGVGRHGARGSEGRGGPDGGQGESGEGRGEAARDGPAGGVHGGVLARGVRCNGHHPSVVPRGPMPRTRRRPPPATAGGVGRGASARSHSTVTDLARLRGWSTS